MLLENSESHDYVSSYYYCIQNDVAVVQTRMLPKDNTVEERHHVLNNCLSKNVNVIFFDVFLTVRPSIDFFFKLPT